MKPPRTRPTQLPPLKDGDRMTQEEFHRRYEAYPEDVKIELIGGVVHVASPMKGPHGLYSFEVNLALGIYKASTPGVEGAAGISAILNEKGEPMPDLLLRLHHECGGQSRFNDRQYLEGAPEFIAEVSDATLAIDLNRKKKDYLETGVQEYLVLDLVEREIHWFHFPSKRKLKPGKDGVWRSREFPGLWIDGPALLARDSAKLIAAVQRGLASAEHAAFVRLLASRHG